MRLVGSARVSTTEGHQVLDRQLDALNAAGCERVFENHASGTARSPEPHRLPRLPVPRRRLGRPLPRLARPLRRRAHHAHPHQISSTSTASDPAPSTRPWTPPRRQAGPCCRSGPRSPIWGETSAWRPTWLHRRTFPPRDLRHIFRRASVQVATARRWWRPGSRRGPTRWVGTHRPVPQSQGRFAPGRRPLRPPP